MIANIIPLKIGTQILAQVIFFIRIFQINQLDASARDRATSDKTGYRFEYLWMLFLLNAIYLLYLWYIEKTSHNLNYRFTLDSCLEAQSYEEIWQQTICHNISDAVLFVND
jgi:hypothetical protein